MLFKIRILPALLLVLLSLAAQAQTPLASYAPAAVGRSGFVFGNNLAHHNHTLYPPGFIVGGGTVLGTLYFRYGSNGTDTLTNPRNTTLDALVISLGQTDSTRLRTSGSFDNKFFPASMLKRVLVKPRLFIPVGVEGQWFAIHTDSLFTVDPTRSLIVDIKFNTSSNQVFGVYASPGTNDRLRVYTDNLTDSVGSSSLNVPHFGYDNQVAIKPTLAQMGIIVAPNPSSGSFTVHAPIPFRNRKYYLCDVMGRNVGIGNLSGDTRISGMKAGIYFLMVDGMSQRVVVE